MALTKMIIGMFRIEVESEEAAGAYALF